MGMNQPNTFLDKAKKVLDKIIKLLDAIVESKIYKFLVDLESLEEALNKVLDKFDKVIGKRLDRYGQRLTRSIKAHQKLIFVLLLNLIVLAYYAGQANATDLQGWWSVTNQFTVIYWKFIWATIIAIFLFEMYWVLKWVMRIGFVILCILGLYKCYKWLRPKFKEFLEDD
jgi:hypothetical protein